MKKSPFFKKVFYRIDKDKNIYVYFKSERLKIMKLILQTILLWITSFWNLVILEKTVSNKILKMQSADFGSFNQN